MFPACPASIDRRRLLDLHEIRDVGYETGVRFRKQSPPRTPRDRLAAANQSLWREQLARRCDALDGSRGTAVAMRSSVARLLPRDSQYAAAPHIALPEAVHIREDSNVSVGYFREVVCP
jgi:hypothetical protein